MKTPLSPLTIPDANTEKDAALEISAETSKSLYHCASLKPDCLLSPMNPAMWKGASPRARFGLDIGGTLCKVVYFEPFDNLDSGTPLSTGVDFPTTDMYSKLIQSDSRQDRKEILHVEHRIGDNSLEVPFGLEECCCSLKLPNFSQESEELRGEVSCIASPAGSKSGGKNEQGCISICNEINPDQSASIACLFTRKEDLANVTLDHNRDHVSNSKYCNHVRKLWVSSHDPVILPGRGTLYFKCFETWNMEDFLFLTKEHSLVKGRRALGATGGGARKFGSQFLEIAGLQLNHFDELKSLVQGIDFLMKYAQHESFEYSKGFFQGGIIQRPFRSPEDSSNDSDENLSEEESSHSVHQFDRQRVASEKTVNGMQELAKSKVATTVLPKGLGWHEDRTLYPYLVVNIGSGVSILLVESPEQFKRVGGTSLGGSTFFGLASVLTGCTSFKEAIDLAAKGDSTEIDMLVGDIYGGDYSEMDLAATTVASSFGKLVQPSRRAAAMNTPQHLAKATLLMITNNIGSLAKLHAQATGVEHVLFTGSFMHGNKLAMRLLSVAMEFWSKGQIKAIFLRHEGHAGAMGALLSALDPSNQTDSLLLS